MDKVIAILFLIQCATCLGAEYGRPIELSQDQFLVEAPKRYARARHQRTQILLEPTTTIPENVKTTLPPSPPPSTTVSATASNNPAKPAAFLTSSTTWIKKAKRKRPGAKRRMIPANPPTTQEPSSNAAAVRSKIDLDPNNIYDDEGDLEAKIQRKRSFQTDAWGYQVNLQYNNYSLHDLYKWLDFNATDSDRATTPKQVPYGKCAVSKGAKGGDGDCLIGEVCVDEKTLQVVKCATGSGAPGSAPGCPPCPPGGPVTGCPRGCSPTNKAECVFETDGICVDDFKTASDYVDSNVAVTEVQTPMLYFPGELALGEPCSAYGDAINAVQKGSWPYPEKSKKLRTGQGTKSRFGTEICNWSIAHLECIPDDPRHTTTTKANEPQSQSDIENYITPHGKCKCMLSLGPHPDVVKDEESDVKICYIPANMGHSSECDHDIGPPHGAIEGIKKDGSYLLRASEPAGMFCTPNAECRTGYKYTGLRCMCKPKFIWQQKTGSCSKAFRIGSDILFCLTAAWVAVYANIISIL